MARIAGDDPGYTFRLCRKNGWKVAPTKHGFVLPSVSTIIGEVLAKPPSAMAWWGFRIFRDGMVDALADGESFDGLDAESAEELLKVRGVHPNASLEEAGDRGTDAHAVLELLANGKDRSEVLKAAQEADEAAKAEYGQAAIAFWDENVQPNIDAGHIDGVYSELPVFSLRHRYAGTFDLGLHWVGEHGGWEILDAKTHKPASGFTKPGKGAGYVSDATQNRAYRTAFEEMGLGHTIAQRTVVLRDKAYKGVRWLGDSREVSEAFWLDIRALYDERVSFEAGE